MLETCLMAAIDLEKTFVFHNHLCLSSWSQRCPPASHSSLPHNHTAVYNCCFPPSPRLHLHIDSTPISRSRSLCRVNFCSVTVEMKVPHHKKNVPTSSPITQEELFVLPAKSRGCLFLFVQEVF